MRRAVGLEIEPQARGLGASDLLRLAVASRRPEGRAQFARLGLASLGGGDDELQFLLLRQLYLAHLERGHLRRALGVAGQMQALHTPLEDLAHHDASRALQALGELSEAIGAQRLAARTAPVERRSFHLWGLGTLLHLDQQVDAALRTFARAERWARRDRALIRAHAAYVRLDAGRAVDDIEALVADLLASPNRAGYGQFVLGMLHALGGDVRRARQHLRAFLRRHTDADSVRALTLREEIRRATAELARLAGC